MEPASEGLRAPEAGARPYDNPILSDSKECPTTPGLRLLRQLKLEDRVRLVERFKVEFAGATDEAGQALVKWAQSVGEAAAEAWAERAQAEQNTAQMERAAVPETPVPAISAGDCFAASAMEATATEVLILAVGMVWKHGEAELAKWLGRVLAQEERYQELGALWTPPGTKDPGGAEWCGKSGLLSAENGLAGALTYDGDVLRAIARVVHGWTDGVAATLAVLPVATLKKYITKLKTGVLSAPSRSAKTKKGSPRWASEAVRNAQVLRKHEPELRRRFEQAYEVSDFTSPSKAQLKELHVAELEQRDVKHDLELKVLHDSLLELDGIVDAASAQAKKTREAAAKVKVRAKTARSEVAEKWKKKVEEMRQAWKLGAEEDVEEAHNEAMAKLKKLKASAHAAKRAAEARATTAATAKDKESNKAKKAQELADILQQRVEELQKELEGGAAEAVSKLKLIRQLGTQSRGEGGGRGRWWPWWVRAMVMEQLVNGTPPTSISANIVSDAGYMVPFLEPHVPSINFCRRMRRELRTVTETLVAYRVAKAGAWRQLFTDGTGRRQTPLLTTVVAINGDDGKLVPVVLRAGFVIEGETSEMQVQAILEKVIARGGLKLARLRAVFESLHPGVEHDIPEAREFKISKLGGGGAVTSDNCNGAMKVKRLLVRAVQEAVAAEASEEGGEWARLSELERAARELVMEVDCWNHLRNVWLEGVTAALAANLRAELRDELEEIESRLRVGVGIESLLRAVDKEFSLCANYPKGHGDLFKEWVERCHPRALLLHVERTKGSRQDLAFEGAGAVYLNRPFG